MIPKSFDKYPPVAHPPTPEELSATKKAARTVYVYAIGVDRHYVRFGVSRDPASRIADFQRGMPVDVSVLAQLACSAKAKAVEIESRILQALQRYAMRGGWFSWHSRTAEVVHRLRVFSHRGMMRHLESLPQSPQLGEIRKPMRRRFQ